MALSTEDLISEFLAFRASKISETERLIAKCERQLEKEPSDRLNLCILTLKTTHADDTNQSFNDCCAVAAPIFKHLKETKGDWDFLDLHIISLVIGYLHTFKKTIDIVKEALELLNDKAYADDYEYKKMRFTLHLNLTLRFLRARYMEANVDIPAVTKAFAKSYNYAIERCKRNNGAHQYVQEIRKAVFENEQDKIQECLEKLLERGERKMYRIAKAEIAEFLSAMSNDLRKPLSYILFGHQHKKRRLYNNMSLEDLSFLTDVEPTNLNAMERGDEGVSLERARRLANAL
ncbi:MAG: helix-turn-helix transcriptional regulator, partial [Defluviitaleaceae bacterium]|nr:helix-turn-helix transcriptional regulator [Defluviitaleaceae bacterium]